MKKLLTTACLFVVTVVAIVSFIPPVARAQEAKQLEREARRSRYMDAASKVKGGSITPHWMSDSSFWYAEGTPDNTVVYKVDPEANTKMPLFDTARLRKALATLLGHEPPFRGLPFAEFTFENGEKAVRFAVEKQEFVFQLDTYTITRAVSVPDREKNRWVPREVRQRNPIYEAGQILEGLSPDKRWFATLRDHNLWLRSPVVSVKWWKSVIASSPACDCVPTPPA